MHENLQVKCRRPRPGTKLRASLRNRNALAHVTRAILHENLQVKCRRPRPGTKLCASLRSRNAFGLHKSHLAREFTGKMPQGKSATHTLCQLAQSKCAWTFHKKSFCASFACRKNPSVWTRCLGEKREGSLNVTSLCAIRTLTWNIFGYPPMSSKLKHGGEAVAGKST